MKKFTLTGDLRLLDGQATDHLRYAVISLGGPVVWTRQDQGTLDSGYDLKLTVRSGRFGRPLPGWVFGWRPWVLVTVEYDSQQLDIRFDRYRASGWLCTAIEVDVQLLCGRPSRLRRALLPSTFAAAIREIVALHINDGAYPDAAVAVN